MNIISKMKTFQVRVTSILSKWHLWSLNTCIGYTYRFLYLFQCRQLVNCETKEKNLKKQKQFLKKYIQWHYLQKSWHVAYTNKFTKKLNLGPPKGFEKRSANWCSVLTCSNVLILYSTKSRMKWCFMSTWLIRECYIG
jgi:hypothetical protein